MGSEIKPVDSFKEAAALLRRPFTPAAVKFKVQSVLGDNKGALIIAYIDARLVVERLNMVVPHLWQDDYRPVGQGQMWCDLTVDGITRHDIGEGTGKGLVSDALKRAAVKFGVGVSLYAVPQITLWVGTAENQIRTDRKGRPIIDDRTDVKLRQGYAKWLKDHGDKAFGAALDHGDVEGSTGALEEEGAPSEAAVMTTPETGELATTAQVNFIQKIVKGEARNPQGSVQKPTLDQLDLILGEIEPGLKATTGWAKRLTKRQATLLLGRLTEGSLPDVENPSDVPQAAEGEFVHEEQTVEQIKEAFDATEEAA